jgi:crotonobetainyl-CoA:carnitine CoA-transferase CaiB-like acyl-CoA transferase
MNEAPLAGVRVLELARILAGPWAGQLLADLGAEVIKVERRGAGDDTRGWGPPFVAGKGGRSLSAAYFHSTNRGKRSVEIDFGSSRDLQLLQALAGETDILIENFKVGGLTKYGLDFPTLSSLNPSLIYCSITGFGQTGPYAPRAGYDFIIQAMGGIMHLTGEAEREPQKIGVAFADIFTGLYAVVAIQAALIERQQSGRGQHIDASLYDSLVAVLANQALNYFVSGKSPKRMGNAHPNIVPYQVFPAADGDLVIAVGSDDQFRRLCSVLGLAEVAGDPRYVTNAQRVENRDSLVAALVERTRSLARADLLVGLEGAGVPAGPIQDLAEVFSDPQVIARGMRIDFPEPEAESGTVPGLRVPVLLSRTPLGAGAPSPRLGSDNEDLRTAFAAGRPMFRDRPGSRRP